MRFIGIGAFILLFAVSFFLTGVSSQSIVTDDLLTETNKFQKAPNLEMLSGAIKDVTGQDVNASPSSSITKLVGSVSEEYTFFGIDVAIDGDTAVVGAYKERTGPYRMGAVHVFVWNGSSWGHQQKLSPPPNSNPMDFGRSVGISGNTIIIGAPSYHCSASAVNCGAIFFFQRSGTTWTQSQERVVATDFEDTDWFGWDVAISGDTAIVGENSHPVVQNSGAAYFFQRIGSVWTEVQRVTHGGNTNDLFGYSVAIDGDTAAISFPRYSNSVGGARVYQRNGSTWAPSASLLPIEPNQGCFGESVSISGNSLLVGAPCSQSGSVGGAGYVFVNEPGAGWQQEVKLTAPDAVSADGLGVGGAIDGDRVILGAWVNNGGRGAAYTFSRCLTDWGFEEKLVAADGAPGDNFGRNVALFENKAISGSPFADIGGIDDQGAAYVTVITPQSRGAQCDISIIVNRTTDEPDDDIEDDVCDIDENTLEHECTLRAAIETANARQGRDIITFDIPGGGIKTISPGSNLPYLEESASINAASQPGYTGTPLIQLSGGAMGVNPGLGLIAGSDNSRVKGLAIYGFETNIAIQSSGSSVEACYLGLKADGTAPTSTQQVYGVVLVNGASNNAIGGTEIGDGNVIGSLTVGVGMYGGSGSNRILNNKIGTNLAGDTAMPTEVGVVINGSNGNRIGQAGGGNLISGSTFAGVLIFGSSSTMVRSNKIGTNAAGTGALPNLHGIAINGGTNNKIGDITLADGNLVSGNTGFGVVLYNSTANNRIINNSVGTVADGTNGLANRLNGVFIEGGANNNIVEKNVIGGHNFSNTSAGVGLSASAGTDNIVKGNFIGVVRDGTGAIPNTFGIVNLSDGQIIGAQNEGNVIGHNVKSGIVLVPAVPGSNPTVNNNTVHYNFVGTTGTADIGNGEFGILLEGDVTLNTVTKNIVSGNTTFGIALTDNVHDNSVKENFVGTNLAGDAAIPNGGGIWIRQARDNEIESNLVSGNSLGIVVGTNFGIPGSLVEPSEGRFQGRNTGGEYTTGNKIFGNIVGLNGARTASIPGSSVGILVGENARDNTIGSATGAYNLVSGNTATIGYGIFIGTFAANPTEDSLPQMNTFQGNVVGLAGNLQTPIPNKLGFVLLNAVNNTIGGSTRDLGNTIVGATEDGVQLTDGSRQNTIENNFIGVLPSPQNRIPFGLTTNGANPLGNVGSGIKIIGRSISNRIKNNLIGNNGRHGIEIELPAAPAAADEPTLITGNNIGVTLNQVGTGLVDIGNVLSGISIKNSTNVQIGDAGAVNANVIGKNGEHGIKIAGNPTSGQALAGKAIKAVNNMVGMIRNSQDEPVAAGNAFNGLLAQNFTGLEVGGDIEGLANRIVANGRSGLLLKSVNPTAAHPVAARVRGNSIGAIADALGNISSNLGNLIGGIETEDSSAIEIGTTDTSVPPNLVASNIAFGVKAKATRAAKLARNIIIKNQGPGVHLYQSSDTDVIGNGIGLALGADIADSGNTAAGILVEESPGITIGGSEPADFNKIGKQALVGAIHVLNTHPGPGVTQSTTIKGNLLGGRTTTFGGIVARASNKVGVLVENSSDVTIGGTEPTGGNSVVANSGPGVRLVGAATSLVSIINNRIGTLATHHGTSTDAMGNDEDGVQIEGGANGNTVGGDSSQPRPAKEFGASSVANTIASNGRNGILLKPTAGNNNRLGGNNIFGNVRFGIDIGNDGASANDPLDADVGPNNLQNYPQIISTQVVNNDLIVNFRLDSAPENSAYGMIGILIEFFKANASGEGERYIGSTRYTLDDYNSLVPGIKTVNLGNLTTIGIGGNDAITSTATDANGNTSEFTPRFGPTAANVNVSGRVTTADGAGLRNAVVSITDMEGNTSTARTGSFGYYKFEDVPAGATYVIAVSSKKYSFSPRMVTIVDSVTDIDFVANY